MAIENGDFIRMNYTGRFESTGDVYETTIEEIAREAGTYSEKSVYKPIPAIIGQTQLFPEITEAILESDVGDKMTVKVPCEHAFGERRSELVELVSVKELRKNGINPVKGAYVQYKGMEARILTINGGRVKLDYNHPYAGRDIIADVEVCEKIEGDDNKIKAIVERYYPNQSFDFDKTTVEWNDNVLNIKLDPAARFDQDTYMNITLARFNIAREIYTAFENITKVNFVDEFEKPEPKTEEESEE